MKAIRNDKIKVIKNGEECRVNCYGIAYTTLDFLESGKCCEHHVEDVYSCGGLVSTKSHSARFPYLFLSHVYEWCY